MVIRGVFEVGEGGGGEGRGEEGGVGWSCKSEFRGEWEVGW